MESQGFSKKKNGFIVFLLDFLFVAIGVTVLVVSLAEREGMLATISAIFRR